MKIGNLSQMEDWSIATARLLGFKKADRDRDGEDDRFSNTTIWPAIAKHHSASKALPPASVRRWLLCHNFMVSDISMVLVQDLPRRLWILDWFQEAAKTCCIPITVFFSASAGAHSNSTDIKRARRRNPNRFLRSKTWHSWHLPVVRLPHSNTKIQWQTMSPPVQHNSGLFPCLVEQRFICKLLLCSRKRTFSSFRWHH